MSESGTSDELGMPGRSILGGLLCAWIVIPTLAFWPGWVEGQVSFTLYREIKHVALAVLGWLWITALAWRLRRHTGSWLESIGELGRRPALLLFGAWLSWMTLGRAWVRVPENHAYEMLQWLLLGPALLGLLAWHQRSISEGLSRAGIAESDRSPVEILVVRSLVLAIGLVTIIGCIQLWRPLPWLLTIQPELGAPRQTSVFGWKNPMAMAMVGQVFLLIEELVREWRRSPMGPSGLGWLWALLLVLELVFLSSLASRTSYLAFAAGLVFLLFFGALGVYRSGRLGALPVRPIVAFALLAAIGLGSLLAASPRFRERLGSTAEHLAHPEVYWHSDRGTYLRNTLVMVEHHPWGVGLGDWQTHYPVFRKFDRDRSFSPEIQVRRAHSDHVQVLGEGGWLGLGLWLAALGVSIASPLRSFLRDGDRIALFRAAQLTAFVVAMATDYVVEMPYHKMLFALLLFLALARGRAPSRSRDPDGVRGRIGITLGAGAASLLAAVLVTYHLGLGAKVILAARANMEHRLALGPMVDSSADLENGAGNGQGGRLIHPERLRRVVASGLRFERLPGFHKGLHRDYAVFASAALHLAEARDRQGGGGEEAAGWRGLARHWTERSLDLHPHYVVAMKLMSRIAVDRQESDDWLRSYYYVLTEAEEGDVPDWQAESRELLKN